jgi:hypothetical protein
MTCELKIDANSNPTPDQIAGCKRLIAAVIEQAVSDASWKYVARKTKTEKERAAEKTRKRNGERIRSSAKRWLLSDDNHPFSFVWCAEGLDLNPEYLRRKLSSVLVKSARHRRNGV